MDRPPQQPALVEEDSASADASQALHEEYQYLDMVRSIIAEGARKPDRTRVGTRSVFGRQMRFSLANGTIPVFTTKSVYWKAVVRELLFFIAGDTNANHLSEVGVHIWDKHSSKEWLASVGLGHRERGDIGPMYGWQWRHYGAEYVDMHTDYTGKGIDQLKIAIELLVRDPFSRRIVMDAYNPADLPLMALPPCHGLVQFSTEFDDATKRFRLSCSVYQRSADMGLGVPFNVASYSLLTHIFARALNMDAKELVYTTGDTHVYENHVEPLLVQASRVPKPFPRVDLSSWVVGDDPFKAITERLEYDDCKLVGYEHHPAVRMEMAV